jgi:hypothetical protein
VTGIQKREKMMVPYLRKSVSVVDLVEGVPLEHWKQVMERVQVLTTASEAVDLEGVLL